MGRRGNLEVDYSLAMLELPNSLAKKIALIVLAMFFVAIGVGHFVSPDPFVAIMPDYLPLHLELVYLSGVFEVGLGLAVLFRPVRQWAGYGIVALLIAVYPANINMALNPEPFLEQGMTMFALYARLPLQFVLMAWAIWVTRPDTVGTVDAP